jgi:hypothetical protein
MNPFYFSSDFHWNQYVGQAACIVFFGYAKLAMPLGPKYGLLFWVSLHGVT